MWSTSKSTLWPAVLVLAHNASNVMAQTSCSASANVDLGWYPPNATMVNNLSAVLNSEGVYGFVFNATTPFNLPYSTYNWCNMPHVRSTEYQPAPSAYKLEYVEVIHRHHKRTPYASNTFPRDNYAWYCDDQSLAYAGIPLSDSTAAQIAWAVSSSPEVNPFAPAGFNGTSQFPQITAQGLLDSRQHGLDLFDVYHKQLNFLPANYDPSQVQFRVTNNVITSQVASQVVLGMFPDDTANTTVRVHIQPASIDSLEPTYSCPASTTLRSTYGVGSNFSNWTDHLTAPETVDLFARLESVSNVNSSDSADDWYSWFDHYFDNLSSRLCHQKPLPCSWPGNGTCVSGGDAEAVFRRGQWEYSFIYRDSPSSLASSAASYGVWLAELAGHFRAASGGGSQDDEKGVIYRHNIAHDGSISRLLSILQIEQMVWPGMGSEIVFELYSRNDTTTGSDGGCGGYFLRFLWNGQALRSSTPSLQGEDGMVKLETFLGYVDGLVGRRAEMVPGLCEEKEEGS